MQRSERKNCRHPSESKQAGCQPRMEEKGRTTKKKKQDLNLQCAGVSFIKYACLWFVDSIVPSCGL